MDDSKKLQLRLESLHDRHSGLTKPLGDSFYEAASVCLDRHHESPVDLDISSENKTTKRSAAFVTPDQRVQNAWANEIDTTESGAYGVSLAAVEVTDNLVAVRRAEKLTGADWYIAPFGTSAEDLECCLRLEVSGVDAGNRSDVEARLRQKVEQARRGQSNLPAMASVVGFKERIVLIRRVGESK